MGNYKYLFGPVPSRRFGRSLGVDLTPYKTCSLDCVFCQLGRASVKTITRQEYVPLEMVLFELEDWLKKDGRAQYITLSGSGEPTLHSRFGEVLEFINNKSTISTAVLTNGTMLHLPEVRHAAALANVVKVSLSAWNQSSYGWINRPHRQLQFDQLIEGQKAFRAQFKGQLWMEVFLVGGINSIPNDVRKIAAFAKEIGPDRIHLNTAVRPPAEDFATALTRERMEELIHLFHPTAEVITDFSAKYADHMQVSQEEIFSMLKRRPCTANQIGEIFSIHLNEVSKYLGNLIRNNQIRTKFKNTSVYYTAINAKAKFNDHI